MMRKWIWTCKWCFVRNNDTDRVCVNCGKPPKGGGK